MDPDLSLLQDFAVIMVIAAAVSVVFRHFNQPVVLGYLVAGYIVGPHSPPFSLVHNVGVIREFADFGIVLLMFGLGLEFSLDRIRKVGLVSIVGAAVEIGIMIVLGYLLGRAFGWKPLEAVFLGAALSISSTAIIVKVLQEMGRLDRESSRVMFGILVVEDFFAVAIMTVLSGIGTTGEVNVGDIGSLVFKLILFAVVSLALGLHLFSKFVDVVARMHSREVLIVLTIGSAFAMALFADKLGLSIAAGAFIIGAITAESKSAREIHHLSEPVRDIFGALFFVAMGMLIDLRTLAQYVVPVILIVLLVILGKMVACYIGVFLSGYRKRTAFEVGTGMSQVGEFSLVITKIGHETGATGAFLQPLMATVSAITALTTPYLIRSSGRMADLLSRGAPLPLRRVSNDLEFWAARVRRLVGDDSPSAHRARQSLAIIALNLFITGALLLGAERAIEVLRRSRISPLEAADLNLVIGGGAVLLCVPPVFAIWRALRTFLAAVVQWVTQKEGAAPALRQRRIVDTLPVAMATGILVLIILEATPLIIRLVAVANPIYLLPIGLMGLIIAWLAWESLDKFHRRVEQFLSLRDSRTARSTAPEEREPHP